MAWQRERAFSLLCFVTAELILGRLQDVNALGGHPQHWPALPGSPDAGEMISLAEMRSKLQLMVSSVDSLSLHCSIRLQVC